MRRKPKKRKAWEDQTYREMERQNGPLDVLARQFFNQSQVDFGKESQYYPNHLEPNGIYQWMHIIGRDESPILKYSLLNGVCGSSNVHVFFTYHPTLWRAFIDEVLPGRIERLLAMDRWAVENKALFRREDVLIENRKRFLAAKESGVVWKDYDFGGYLDPIEALMERLG